MENRAQDWFEQAERDLEHARASQAQNRHEWACFAAQQSAEKPVKALHLGRGQEAWGHVIARLLVELPLEIPKDLIDAMDQDTLLACRSSRPNRAHQDRQNKIRGTDV